jgi:hypothetical protein
MDLNLPNTHYYIHIPLQNHHPPFKKKAEICPSHITPNPSLSTSSLKTTSNQGAMPAEMSNHDSLSLPRLICTSKSPEAGGRHDATRVDGPGERDTWGMEHDGNEPLVSRNSTEIVSIRLFIKGIVR